MGELLSKTRRESGRVWCSGVLVEIDTRVGSVRCQHKRLKDDKVLLHGHPYSYACAAVNGGSIASMLQTLGR